MCTENLYFTTSALFSYHFPYISLTVCVDKWIQITFCHNGNFFVIFYSKEYVVLSFNSRNKMYDAGEINRNIYVLKFKCVIESIFQILISNA